MKPENSSSEQQHRSSQEWLRQEEREERRPRRRVDRAQRDQDRGEVRVGEPQQPTHGGQPAPFSPDAVGLTAR